MHAAASIPETPRLVIAALPAVTASPIETGIKKTAPRKRSKSEGFKSISVNGILSADQRPKDNGNFHAGSSISRKRSGDHVNGRQSRENGTRARRSISSITGESAAGGLLSSPTGVGEQRAADGERDVAPAGRRRRRGRLSRNKDAPVDEKTRISRRIKNLVNRIRQEQNLLDAYAGEGWKGNAREKIRPEKELQRAESQILRCKLAIRDLIKELDHLALEGSLQQSAFDEEGQIFHEEIFCAKCKSQETFADNDIILCDGACDRGFHQACVDPPLATADIPPGDEGWLCPVCESKVECLNFMNDFLGTDYQVEDSWEKIFPSAAAASERAANPSLGEDWPSEDSDDDDYDPERKPPTQTDNDAERTNGGESTLERAFAELNSLDGSASEPEASSGSGSGSAPASESGRSDDDSGSSDCSGDELEPGQPNSQPDRRSRRGERKGGIGLDSEPIDLASDALNAFRNGMEAAEDEEVVPVSGKRQRIPVDYKRLHKEMFGEHDDDMLSEDDEWGPGRPGRRRAGKLGEGVNGLARRAPTTRSALGDQPQGAESLTPAGQQADERNNDNANAEEQFGNGRTRKLSSAGGKVLREVFDSGTHFPTRATKEELAHRLGVSFKQVSSWFKTARYVGKYGTPRARRHSKAGSALENGETTGREGGVDEMEMTNGLLVEKLDEVQMKLHYLRQTLEAMVANRDAGSQPNGKHILYVPVAEVVEKDAEIPVQNGTL